MQKRQRLMDIEEKSESSSSENSAHSTTKAA